MRLNLYLDFDGPILDFSLRSYCAYKDALNLRAGEKPLDRALYWQKKRQKVTLTQIYHLSGGTEYLDTFTKRYLRNIENKRYLLYNRLQRGARRFLRNNAKAHRLVLVTLRKNKISLRKELRRFKIERFFDKILSAPSGNFPYKIKVQLIKKDKSFNKELSWLIGDTEADILAAHLLGINSMAVLSGIRSHAFLRALNPTRIVDDISKIRIPEGE